MSNILFVNFAQTNFASPLSSGGTSLTVLSGAGAQFPSPTGGQYFLLVLTSATIPNTNEIVKVTARSGDVMTIVRAQEGTTALNWSAGDIVENDLTAGSISALQAGFPISSRTVTVSTSFSISDSGGFINVGGSATVQTLPSASTVSGMPIGFFASSAFTLTITPSGGAFEGGVTNGDITLSIAAADFICIQSDGTNWRIFSASPNILIGGTPATQAWVTANFDPLGAAAAAQAAAESYAAAAAATAQSNAETFATGAVAALRATLLQVTPVSNAVAADWRSAGSAVNCSVSFTAPCNGVVLAMSSINLNAPAASGSLVIGTLTIHGTTESTDQTQETQAHFGALIVTSGESVTGNIQGSGSLFPIPAIQATLHITMFFLPTP